MQKTKLNSNPAVKVKFQAYPPIVIKKMEKLRELILETADEIVEIKELEETLKWGEPSYISKIGSTLRMDWKEKYPNQYAMYFKCTTRLVPTFQKRYGDLFKYEKTRAIVFKLEDDIPEQELKECIKMTLMYHKIKKNI